MTKPNKSSKSSPKPAIKVQDLKPESDPKGGATPLIAKALCNNEVIEKSAGGSVRTVKG